LRRRGGKLITEWKGYTLSAGKAASGAYFQPE